MEVCAEETVFPIGTVHMETNLDFAERRTDGTDRSGLEVLSKRTLANRRNAQKSTRPRTAEGKAASRRNAVKGRAHGLGDGAADRHGGGAAG